MLITVDIPDELAVPAFSFDLDPSRATLEAIALEGYRSRRLTESQVRRLLGYSTRMEVHTFLAAHRVELNYTSQDLEQDIAVAKSVAQEYRDRSR